MQYRITILAVAIGILASVAAPARAQTITPRSTIRGVHLGVALNATALRLEGWDESESGGGATLRLGYGFSDRFVGQATLQGGKIKVGGYNSSFTVSHFDIGARYYFSSSESRGRPYAEAALSGREVSLPLGVVTVDARGGGFSFGGGIAYFFKPTVALDAGLKFTSGKFTEGRIGSSGWTDQGGDAFKGTSSRLDLGISWHL